MIALTLRSLNVSLGILPCPLVFPILGLPPSSPSSKNCPRECSAPTKSPIDALSVDMANVNADTGGLGTSDTRSSET
jgi:hypothetical protein